MSPRPTNVEGQSSFWPFEHLNQAGAGGEVSKAEEERGKSRQRLLKILKKFLASLQVPFLGKTGHCNTH
jgi:hypothetical protein